MSTFFNYIHDIENTRPLDYNKVRRLLCAWVMEVNHLLLPESLQAVIDAERWMRDEIDDLQMRCTRSQCSIQALDGRTEIHCFWAARAAWECLNPLGRSFVRDPLVMMASCFAYAASDVTTSLLPLVSIDNWSVRQGFVPTIRHQALVDCVIPECRFVDHFPEITSDLPVHIVGLMQSIRKGDLGLYPILADALEEYDGFFFKDEVEHCHHAIHAHAGCWVVESLWRMSRVKRDKEVAAAWSRLQ